MQRRARVNLLLLVAVAVAGGLVWHDVSSPPPPAAIERVTGLDPRAVTRLRITREADRRVLEFAREAGRWWLLREPRLPADALRVGEVLRLVDARSEASYDLAEVDARELGLDPPRVRLDVDGTELGIGAQEALHYRRYVASGGRVHLVPDTAYVHLGADWPAFVDPAPLAGLPELHAVAYAHEDDATEPDPERVAAWRDLVADTVRAGVAPNPEAVEVSLRFADRSARRLVAWRREATWWLAWRDGAVSYGVPAERGPELGLE